MKTVEFVIKIVLLLFIWSIWWLASDAQLPGAVNLSIIVGGTLLVFPLVWLGRKLLDGQPSTRRARGVTTFVHYSLGILFGLPIVRALVTYREWSGWTLTVPGWIGLILVIVSGAACGLTILNLALKGLGAPFAIALSQRLAADWLYAWTRNPMVLAALAIAAALGVWFQSVLFIVWVLALLAPALLYFVKQYEERELELRFGASYLDYKARTPMLVPRRPIEREAKA